MQVEVVEVNTSIDSTRGESHVVLEPVNGADSALMASVLHPDGAVTGVEVINMDLIFGSTCEKMTSMGELNLLALLHGKGLEHVEASGHNGGHRDFILEGYYDVES